MNLNYVTRHLNTPTHQANVLRIVRGQNQESATSQEESQPDQYSQVEFGSSRFHTESLPVGGDTSGRSGQQDGYSTNVDTIMDDQEELFIPRHYPEDHAMPYQVPPMDLHDQTGMGFGGVDDLSDESSTHSSVGGHHFDWDQWNMNENFATSFKNELSAKCIFPKIKAGRSSRDPQITVIIPQNIDYNSNELCTIPVERFDLICSEMKMGDGTPFLNQIGRQIVVRQVASLKLNDKESIKKGSFILPKNKGKQKSSNVASTSSSHIQPQNNLSNFSPTLTSNQMRLQAPQNNMHLPHNAYDTSQMQYYPEHHPAHYPAHYPTQQHPHFPYIPSNPYQRQLYPPQTHTQFPNDGSNLEYTSSGRTPYYPPEYRHM
ncbi:hypothetical protein MJO29_011931 [Puccinia striiformis f. sp. tritici]|nr:hypothetical protein MJO29_011931 [Puccinia striiformis f. sp. tritici]